MPAAAEPSAEPFDESFTERLAERYRAIRQHSLALVDGLSAEDCAAQAMPDASPQKWHLAHTSWFFETFVLAPAGVDACSPQACWRLLFNSYYQGIGAPYPRAQRGLLTRPSLQEVLAWRERVDAAMLAAIRAGVVDAEGVELGLQHEQQHQELMRTDWLALIAVNPLGSLALSSVKPAEGEQLRLSDLPCQPGAGEPADGSADKDDNDNDNDENDSVCRWWPVPGGLVHIGHAGPGFCFDNELPAHQVFVEPFEMARCLVSQLDYLRFIDDGAYRNPAWWLSDGWDWVRAGQRSCPQYWRRTDAGRWQVFALEGDQVPRNQAVAHLSYYEADAYARWAGARLPTEAEWELAASQQGKQLQGLFGDCWQWTASSYGAYPGYRPAPGALGEYNGKFMVNQQVLRGSSVYTAPGHARLTYRNFFPASSTWQRSGLRLAR